MNSTALAFFSAGANKKSFLKTNLIIKSPFWRMTAGNREAIYACLNYGEAACPREIEKQSICINGDIGEVLRVLG